MQDPNAGEYLITLLDQALREDDAAKDLTSGALPLDDVQAEGTFLVKEGGVIAGFALLKHLEKSKWLGEMGYSAPKFVLSAQDSDTVSAGSVVASLEGSASLLLRLERSMLNLISHLSGVASLTRRFVQAVEPFNADICDTRKTLVGLRRAEKYAVTCGGGVNHRASLGDQAMIKENHLALSGLDIADAIAAIRKQGSQRLTCECENLEEVQHALEAGADCVLLDNFSLMSLKQAISLRAALNKQAIPFEASGGVNLNTVAAIAETGVERISVGALTHSAPSLDISFKIHRS